MQKLQLSIPEPCHENWQQMTPTQQGRFCNACAKEVIDFSTMTDIQVLNYFTNLTHEKVCGRALPEQLDRTITRPEPPKKRLFWYWNYIVMFFMFFTKGNATKAQVGTKTTTCAQAVTAAELEKVQINKAQIGVNEALAGKVGKVAVNTKIITGKITDEDGNAVPFASIKVKGTTTGVSADALGAYSIKLRQNAILVVSAAGLKETEVPAGNLNVINTVLERSATLLEGNISVVVGGIGFRNDDAYDAPLKMKSVAVIKVQDAATNKFIPNASVIIHSASSIDTVLTDKKGEHKIKGIKNYESYFVKVIADGYEANEFTIDGSDFKDRKKEWEVLLKKQKAEPVKPAIVEKARNQNLVRLGAVQAENLSKKPLYVVDGKIVPSMNSIRPEDVDNIEVLQGPAAAALFGFDGMNGAILITTRKTKEKILDTVAVSSIYDSKRTKNGGMGVTVVYKTTYLDETKSRLMTIITDSLKVYPNPVQRNSSFTISLKLKETGTYQIQITDVIGKIVLQKQINAVAKSHLETLQPQNWAAGIYYIRVFTKSKLIRNTSFIFE